MVMKNNSIMFYGVLGTFLKIQCNIQEIQLYDPSLTWGGWGVLVGLFDGIFIIPGRFQVTSQYIPRL